MIGELTKSIMRLPWDLSTTGLGMLTKRVLPNENPEDRIGHLLQGAIAASDRLSPGTSLDLVRQAIQTVDSMIPGAENHLVLQEFQNKLQAFGVFEYVESVIDQKPGYGVTLPELVDRAQALEPYDAVWATEGCGHLYANRCFSEDRLPKNLLQEEHLSVLPGSSLITLHAGMGLSFATHVLNSLPLQSSRQEIRDALHRFIAMCRQNSREGYTEIALEALGLVARTMHPRLVPLIDHELSDIDLDILSLFWHGIGRGLYFLPINFVPHFGSAGRAIEMAQTEAPHGLGRRNAIAGIAWPLTLVNIRHPQIMNLFLSTHHRLISDNDSFSQGVSTALITWLDSAPNDPSLKAFRDYRPEDEDAGDVARWEEFVAGPSESAIREYYPKIKKEWRLGELFRYQSIVRITAQIEQA
jgi:hypothetical protein